MENKEDTDVSRAESREGMARGKNALTICRGRHWVKQAGSRNDNGIFNWTATARSDKQSECVSSAFLHLLTATFEY
jgi:hypothetical protein